MLSFLSLVLFTLLPLKWIVKLVRAVPILEETATYDFVVIGGGNAGMAVAGRLSEDPSITVAVLEAGMNAEDFPEVFVPGLIGTEKAKALNWAYQTIPG